MMKVKPFSYHIPPRRKAYRSTSNTSSPSAKIDFHGTYSCTSYSSRNSNSGNNNRIKSSDRTREEISLATPPHSLSNLSSLCCGVGGITVLIVVLLLVGFIGVAGQGKISEMEGGSSSRFPPQSHLSYPTLSHHNFNSLSNLADVFDNEDDEALQQRIASMGQYGVKYRNDSYNYSSHLSPYYYRSQQYKPPGPGGGTLVSTHESLLLSLHDNDDIVDNPVEGDQTVSSPYNSGKLDENKISQQSARLKLKSKQRRKQEGDEELLTQDDLSKQKYPFSSITKWKVPNQTEGDTYNDVIFTRGKNPATSHVKQYKSEESEGDEVNSDKEREERLSPFVDSSGSDADDEDSGSDDDAYVLERFALGNSSGKLRFRQSLQAEVDGVDWDEESLPPTAKESTSRRRPRRSVVHLYDMVVCSTGCNPLIFKGYGCYCGFLGSGLTVDGIDKCCAKHDFCYHHAKYPPLLTYFVPYYCRCDHGRPQCVTDFRGWKGVCGAHLCECDRQFAECLKKFPCPRSRAMCVTSPWRFWQNLLMTPAMRYRY